MQLLPQRRRRAKRQADWYVIFQKSPYARGEIDSDEFERKRRELMKG